MLFSVFGHWLEIGYCEFLRIVGGDYDPNAKLWRDPFDPYFVYGVGGCLCILALLPLKEKLGKHIKNTGVLVITSYLINASAMTFIELIEGLLINQDHKWWDYSGMPFNFAGQICLQNFLAFGLASSCVVWVVFPVLERQLRMMKRSVFNTFAVILGVYFVYFVYLYELPR
jgi:uncharacterized membrane protein